MKDTLCPYYTNSDEITSYMVFRLGISGNDVILEPSAGEGIFIDEILKTKLPVQIDALDIDKKAISVLEKKYQDYDSITVRETDTLLDERLDFFRAIGGYYDKVIGNPPYGAWLDYDKRDLLKKKYPGQYVKETYSLFLLRCVYVLKMGGRLSFIIPDTYMFLNLHAKLREVLLTSTKIEEIITFPSKFFPGVSFSYSNLSIITLERCSKETALNNIVRVVQGFQSVAEFGLLCKNGKLPDNFYEYTLKQSNILNSEKHRFILADNIITDTINKASLRLGTVADVVTGFYTGDNKRFIRVLDKSVKGSKNYDKVDLSLVFPCTSLDGIEKVPEGYVPYVKGTSSTRYYRFNDDWFIRWDKGTIIYYNSNRKSRFQNSSFYFKTGIAIPMVKSSSIRAFLLENRVFDQSIVGIFPRDKSRLYYILAIMNSDIVNNLIHTINPTANNSANYIKQIPYIEPTQDVIDLISRKVQSIISNYKNGNSGENESLHFEINSLIQQIYSNQL